jgi:hypothetical protein
MQADNETNKNNRKQIQELVQWYNTMKQPPVISKDNNYLMQEKNKILYMATKLKIENKHNFYTLSLINEIPKTLLKFKLQPICILRNRILNLFLT